MSFLVYQSSSTLKVSFMRTANFAHRNTHDHIYIKQTFPYHKNTSQRINQSLSKLKGTEKQ